VCLEFRRAVKQWLATNNAVVDPLSPLIIQRASVRPLGPLCINKQMIKEDNDDLKNTSTSSTYYLLLSTSPPAAIFAYLLLCYVIGERPDATLELICKEDGKQKLLDGQEVHQYEH
jgi:hypothetical protein